MNKETFKSIVGTLVGTCLAFFIITEVATAYNEPTIVALVTLPWER